MELLKKTLSIIRFAFKTSWRAIFVLFFVASMAINVTMFAWQAGALALSALYETVTGTQTVVEQFADRNKNLTSKNKSLTSKNKELTSRNNVLTNKFKKFTTHKKAVAKVSNRVIRRTAAVAAINIGSMAAEAIPVAGTAAIVGVTTYEVHAACSTIKDMQEISRLMDADNATDETSVCGLKVPSISDIREKISNSPEEAWKEAEKEVDIPPWAEVEAETKSIWKKMSDGVVSGYSKLFRKE